MITWVLLGIVAAVAVFIIATYNGLITLRNRVEEASSDIDVQLKRRFELIPNLVKAVQGFFKQEKGIFEQITKAREGLVKGSLNDKMAANAELGDALKSLFMLSEDTPEIQSSDVVTKLQTDLTDSQDKIMAAQRFYNANVRDFNTKLQVFPTNMYAQGLGFKAYEFIEATETEKANVEVNL